MGYARIEGNLMAVEVRILFKIREVEETTNLPPIMDQLRQLEKTYAQSTIWGHLQRMKKWGYIVDEGYGRVRFWRLTEKGKELIEMRGQVVVTGKGEVR